MSNKHKNKNRAKEEKPPGKLRRLFVPLARVAGVVALLFTIVTGALFFATKITVTQSAVLDPNDPFSAQFIITNEGVWPLVQLEVSCDWDADVVFDFSKITVPPGGGQVQVLSVPQLDPNRSLTYNCINPFEHAPASTHYNAALMRVGILYKPWGLGWLGKRYVKVFPQYLAQGKDGQWHWFPH